MRSLYDWNVFYAVFSILVPAAVGLTFWFLKLGKRIFLLVPLLLLAGSVAYFAVYYTADDSFPPAQVIITSNSKDNKVLLSAMKKS